MGKSSLEQTKVKQEEFLCRLQEGDYEIERTSELVGITKQTAHRWKRENLEFAAAVEFIQETGSDEKTEIIEQNISKWAMNPTEKVGMVNFLAAMAWLKAHRPGKWNEKSFKNIQQNVTITRIETVKDYGKRHIETEAREIPYTDTPMLNEGSESD